MTNGLNKKYISISEKYKPKENRDSILTQAEKKRSQVWQHLLYTATRTEFNENFSESSTWNSHIMIPNSGYIQLQLKYPSHVYHYSTLKS